MRQHLAALVVLASCAFSQSTPPQTARQALIEMFFGQAPNHLERHLPQVTQHSLNKLSSPGGRNYLSDFSSIAAELRSGGKSLQTFDAGPSLLIAEDVHPGTMEPDRIEITVERDDLIGDEDQIELALHLSRNGKEQPLPVIPRLTFTLQTEADVWRLQEISVNVRVPLADPNFLRTMEDQQRSRNEIATISALQVVNAAETNYSKANGRFACAISSLGKHVYDPELIKGSSNGYNYVISGCDASHYKVVAEPAVSDSEQRAFCSDESGEIRAAADGKATTCLSSGESIQKGQSSPVTLSPVPSETAQGTTAGGQMASVQGTASEQPRNAAASSSTSPKPPVPQRVRVSAGVMNGLRISHVDPSVPPDAARMQGSVMMDAVIGTDGTVQQLKVLKTASPFLNQPALAAARQWKYKPYLLNGQAVEVNTTIVVEFKSPQ